MDYIKPSLGHSVNIAELFYFTFYFFISIGKYSAFTAGNAALQLLAVFGFGFVVCKIIITTYTNNEFITILLIGGICVITYFTNKEGLLFSCLAVIGLKNIPLKKVLKLSLWVGAVVFLSRLIFSSVGLMKNISITKTRFNGLDWVSYQGNTMGYENVNTAYIIIFNLIAIFIYLNYDRLKLHSALYLFLIIFAAYKVNYCRSGFISGIVLILLFMAAKLNMLRRIRFILQNAYIICFTISFSTAFFYSENNKILSFLNRLLSNRLALEKIFLDSYPLKLFGQKIAYIPNGSAYRVLDNAYLNILLSYGVIVIFLYLFFNTVLLRKALKNGNYAICILLISFAVYGVSETFLLNSFLNPSFLFLSELLYTKSPNMLANTAVLQKGRMKVCDT